MLLAQQRNNKYLWSSSLMLLAQQRNKTYLWSSSLMLLAQQRNKTYLWSASLMLLAQQRNKTYLWSLVWPIWCNTQAQKNDVKSILSTWYMDVPFIFHFNMTGFECLLWNSLQIGPSKIWFDYTMYIFMLSFILRVCGVFYVEVIMFVVNQTNTLSLIVVDSSLKQTVRG